MRLLIDVLEVLFDDVRVDLRRGNVCVAQHLLNGAQVGTVFEQMHGKRVAQRVRRDVLRDAGGLLIVLDDLPEALAAHALAVHVDEQRRFLRAEENERCLGYYLHHAGVPGPEHGHGTQLPHAGEALRAEGQVGAGAKGALGGARDVRAHDRRHEALRESGADTSFAAQDHDGEIL